MAADDLLLVWCSCPVEAAEALAAALVGERLAACVNRIGPVQSTYRWQGAIESASETLLAIKTTAARFEALQARLRELHPYEVPEIIATPVSGGLPEYLAWVRESVG
ncbi:MAG: divalent-cation tolerance protein CutA [Rhodanobacteraceae bacterium]|nr:divalent-cation tolerance protein CutA [Rhodanobacteraceae bacterium]